MSKAPYRDDLSLAARKILAGQVVQKNMLLAKSDPFKLARIIINKYGYWNHGYEQGARQVQDIVRRIEAGRDYVKAPVPLEPPEARKPRKRDDSGGLIPVNELKEKKPEKSDTKWGPKRRDRMLNLWFKGKTFTEIALHPKIRRNPYAVERQIETLLYNESFAAEKYQPTPKRLSRKGNKITGRDKVFIRHHRERKIPVQVTARILQRDPNEISRDIKGEIKVSVMRQVGPVTDMLWAHKYLYHCAKKPIISDQAYDMSKKEEMEFGAVDIAKQKASDKVTDYPPHIRYLAYYMLFKFMEASGRWEDNNLPYGWEKEKKQKQDEE